MSGLGTRDQRYHGPTWGITYERGDRVLRDSARSLEAAKAKCEARLAKRHNRGETAKVYAPRYSFRQPLEVVFELSK